MTTLLTYTGSAMFRQRIVLSILSNRPLKISKIRANDQVYPGLQDFEANFLRLIEAMTDGSKIEINETGTTLRFVPGILVGGKLSHDCGLSRAIGWFIEGILPLAAFCKFPLQLTMTGITNDDVDISVDTLQNVTVPLLQNFGMYNLSLKIKCRGVPPKGGGRVELSVPTLKGALSSVYIVEEGLVKRVRGLAFASRVSPALCTRMIDACRGVLNDYLPDVHISTSHHSGRKDAGESPGYSLSLVAETTTGALLSIERTPRLRRQSDIPGALAAMQSGDSSSSSNNNNNSNNNTAVGGEMPETIGEQAAEMLLQEVLSGGVVDSTHQSLVLMLMALTPEDVSKVRLGTISIHAIETMRLLKDVFGVVFRIKEERDVMTLPAVQRSNNKRAHRSDEDDGEDDEGPENDSERDTDSQDESEVEDESVEDSDEVEDDDEEEDNEEAESHEDSEVDGAEDDESEESMDSEESGEDEDDEDDEQTFANRKVERKTYLLSCLGINYVNVNRRVT